jgi:hypothetical protein
MGILVKKNQTQDKGVSPLSIRAQARNNKAKEEAVNQEKGRW